MQIDCIQTMYIYWKQWWQHICRAKFFFSLRFFLTRVAASNIDSVYYMVVVVFFWFALVFVILYVRSRAKPRNRINEIKWIGTMLSRNNWIENQQHMYNGPTHISFTHLKVQQALHSLFSAVFNRMTATAAAITLASQSNMHYVYGCVWFIAPVDWLSRSSDSFAFYIARFCVFFFFLFNSL